MAEFPFQLSVNCDTPEKQTVNLTCTALLRAIEGMREVYDALWDGNGVIVKVFTNRIRGMRHVRREWRGLSELQKRAVKSPRPLFYGKTEKGDRVLVEEKIPDSTEVLELFSKADAHERFELLKLVCREVAEQHIKGIFQKDFHLGNLLLKGGDIFTIDSAKIRFSSGEIAREESLNQLALLSCSLPAGDMESIESICREYASVRGWKLNESDIKLFGELMVENEKRGVEMGLKKCLRTSRRYEKVRAGKCVGVFKKRFCEGEEAIKFVKGVDELMDGGKVLKDGNTCYVSRIEYGGKDIVVKRYNHKGTFHSLRHTLKRSRARRGWLQGHRLVGLRIASPKLLAYIERHKGVLLWESYLVTEYINGKNLYEFLQDEDVKEGQRLKVRCQIREVLDKLGKYHIVHGDLKQSNILVTENGLVLTDFDSMKVYRWGWLFKLKRVKDLVHFEGDICVR